jgi:Mn2+/Fe2+ NRAMP family transporter
MVAIERKHRMRRKFRRLLNALGPGLTTGAADDDPSGIATYSQAGAQFGFALTWTVFLTLPCMTAIQLISACIGWEIRSGLTRNLALRLPSFALFFLVGSLVVANTINIAADLAAMGEALRLVIGGPALVYALIFGVACLVAEVLIPYHNYAGYLKFLTLVLFVYVVAAFTVEVPWSKVIASMLLPKVSFDRNFLLMMVAIFGTTLVHICFSGRHRRRRRSRALAIDGNMASNLRRAKITSRIYQSTRGSACLCRSSSPFSSW